jgi:hypothetical protein
VKGHLPTNRQTLKGRLVLKRSGPVPWQGIGAPAEFRKFVVEYTEKWATVIRAANIKPE